VDITSIEIIQVSNGFKNIIHQFDHNDAACGVPSAIIVRYNRQTEYLQRDYYASQIRNALDEKDSPGLFEFVNCKGKP
jgi:hypothetical protein